MRANREEFHKECLEFWTAAAAQVGGRNPPVTAMWRGQRSIHDALRPFMAVGKNHAHLPTGGGLDVHGVGYSAEHGCLEFDIGEGRGLIVEPDTLTFEYIPESPIDSFLLLQLAKLPASGAYKDLASPREHLVELEPGRYVERMVWDRGSLGHGENGREIPLPKSSRLVTRYLEGKIFIVSKTSLWNSAPGLYHGQHNSKSSADIREALERVLVARGF